MRLPRPFTGLLLPLFLVASGCDAGGSVRLRAEVVDAGSGRPAAGAEIAFFWFELDDDDPFGSPLRQSVAASAERRNHGPSYGIVQRTWQHRPLDAEGRAEFGLLTFYAGALFHPLHQLLWGVREDDPTGLWIRVTPVPEGEWLPHDFLVLEREGVPVPVRMRWSGDRFEAGETAGRVAVGYVHGIGRTWDLRLEILPGERP